LYQQEQSLNPDISLQFARFEITNQLFMTEQYFKKKNFWAWALLTGLLTGTLDILIVLGINYKTPASRICRYIASGFFGTPAFSGGGEMAYYGLLFHYCIALCWTLLFFSIFLLLIRMLKIKLILFVFTGVTIWFAMNLLVLPLSNIPSHHIQAWGAIKEIIILIIAYGLPVTLIAGRYYKK
jgi:hypothetical protein